MSTATPPPGGQAGGQQKPQGASDAEIAAVGGVLAAGAAAGATAGSVALLLGIPTAAVTAVFGITGTTFTQYGPPGGSAYALARRANIRFRIAYLITAARRLAAARLSPDAIARERTYWQGHQKAAARRLRNARRADAGRRQWGDTLGWHAVLDKRTDPVCRAANGRNFLALNPPAIGYPGSVHPNCRCLPGPPFPGAKMVNDSLTVRRAGGLF